MEMADAEEEEEEDRNSIKITTTEEEEEGGGGGVGAKRRCQHQLPYFGEVFACDILLYISDLCSLFRYIWGGLIFPPPYDGRGDNRQLPDGG